MNIYQVLPYSISIPLTVGAIVSGFYLLSYAVSLVVGFVHLLFKDGTEALTTQRMKVPGCNSLVKTDGEYSYFTDKQSEEALSTTKSMKDSLLAAQTSIDTYMFSGNLSWLADSYPIAFYKLSIEYTLTNNSEIKDILQKVDSSKKKEVLTQIINQEQIQSIVKSSDFQRWAMGLVSKKELGMSVLSTLQERYKNTEQVLNEVLANEVI